MRILRTYVLLEHLPPFIITLSALTMVLLIGNIFKFVDLIGKGVSPIDLLRLLIYLTFYMLSFATPMACLIAMIFAFGRLSTDYELIAMRASGISPMRLVSPILIAGLIISAVMLVFNDRIVPWSHLAFRTQLKAIGIKQPTAYLESGTFIKEFEPYIIFVYQVDGRKLHNVRIYEPKADGPTRTIIADRGIFERLPQKGALQLKLFNGTVDEWDPLNPGRFYKVSFSTYALMLHSDRKASQSIGKKIKEMTLRELLGERRQLKASGIETLPVSLELHRKIASSFAPLIFVLFGLGLGLRLHHHEWLISFVWVFTILLGYYLCTIGMNAVAIKGWLSAWAAMWFPNIAGLIIGLPLLVRAVRR